MNRFGGIDLWLWSVFLFEVTFPSNTLCMHLCTYSVCSDSIFVLQVKCGSPMVKAFEREKSYGLPSYVTYTVSLSDPRVTSEGSLSTTLTISSTVTDQSITIPVTIIYITGRSGPVRRKFLSKFLCQNKILIPINVQGVTEFNVA